MRTSSQHELKLSLDSAGLWRLLLAICVPLTAGLLLRLWALKNLYQVIGDSLIYGDIAKNLILHGSYALTGTAGEIYPTLIRLPGYPFLLAACFRIFGMENYFAASCLQITLDLAGCLLLADFVRRIAPAAIARRAALATLWIACLCPFTASYTPTPLAEMPTLFVIALALWSLACFRARPGWRYALLFTFAIVLATLLRPDGALVGVALVPAALLRIPKLLIHPARMARIATVCAVLALAPFALWAVRNWMVFDVFEPLAPRLATDPGEDPHLGWEAWTKTWCLDFVSTYNIYWNVPGDNFDLSQLPARAFDSPAQYAETAALVADYNKTYVISAELDARFARLARERTAAHPWRTHLWMPAGRVADMWLRPRIENLPIDLDWWAYGKHRNETVFSWVWAGLNAFYILAAVAGLCLRPRFWLPMLAYMLLRSALLLTIEAPEARYTLECFPILFVLGGIAIATGSSQLEQIGCNEPPNPGC
jgi:hypothetical protein